MLALPIVAMALPPQIAVPLAINSPVVLSIFNNLANNKPIKKIDTTLTVIKRKDFCPAAKRFVIFMPKPKPTTQAFNKRLPHFALNCVKGFKPNTPITIPANKEIEGVIIGKQQPINNMM